jgi:hypothetical protein
VTAPRLNPVTVADDVLLAAVIDEFLGGDEQNHLHRTKVLEQRL